MNNINIHLKTVGLLLAAILIGAAINYLPAAWAGALIIGFFMAIAYYMVYKVFEFREWIDKDKRLGE